jgi:hypothetical protein
LNLGNRPRPIGVTVLAVLSALVALLFVAITAVALLGLALTTDASFIQALKGAGAPQGVIDNISTILGVTSLVTLVFMMVYFLLAFGFWGGKRWAWGLGVVFVVLTIMYTLVDFVLFPGVTDMVSLILSILVPLIILVYLMMPGVKAYFRGSALGSVVAGRLGDR